jgi:hypothetical protein
MPSANIQNHSAATTGNGDTDHLSKVALLDAAMLARGALEPRPAARDLQETVDTAVERERAIQALDRAVCGATLSARHVFIPIHRAAVHRVLPDLDESRLGEVIDGFRERLEDDLLEEHLPEVARDVCGIGVRP